MRWMCCVALAAMAATAHADPFGPNLDGVVSEMSEATAANDKLDKPGGGGVDYKRQSLDTSIVVEIVHERLREAGIKAATGIVRTLMDGPIRPWMRDLYGAVIDLATNREQSATIAGEAILRIGARAMLADAVVRARLSGKPDAPVVADWLYWRLSRVSWLAGSTDRPECVAGPGRATCDQLAAMDDDGAIAAIDQRTGLDRVFQAIKVAGKLRGALANGVSLRELLAEILAVDPAMTAATLGIDGKTVEDTIAIIKRGEVAYDAIRGRWGALRSALAKVDAAVTACWQDVSCVAGKPAFTAVTTALDELKLVLTTAVYGGKSLADAVKDLAVAMPGIADLLAPALDAVKAYAALAPASLDRAALEKLVLDHAPRDVIELIETGHLEDLKDAVRRVGQDLRTLGSLVGTVDIGTIDLHTAGAVFVAASGLATDLRSLAELVAALRVPGVDRGKLDAIADGAGKLAGWCKLLSSIATGIVDGKLTDVVDVLGALGGGDVAPVLDLLEPVLDDVLATGRLEARQLFVAFAHSSPQAVLSALGLPIDLAVACKDDGSASCWAVRLVMMAHDAVSVDGTTITIQTEKVVDGLSQIAGSRRDQVGKPYLHLAVGTGVLIEDREQFERAKPLVAEQIGVGVKLVGDEDLSLRAALYGSGLLYRFVLDSKESDGVMFGAAVMADLYGDVELYASTAILIAPGATDMDDSTVDWVGTLGVQVPLGAYLEKLAH